MSLSLPKPDAAYNQLNEAAARDALSAADRANQKRSTDVEIADRKLVLTSPDGNRWSVVVSNLGIITAVAL